MNKPMMDLEDIIKNISEGVDAIEKHFDVFTEQEKEDYCYMISNIEVLIRIARERGK